MNNKPIHMIIIMGLLLVFTACNETEEKPSTENDVTQVDTNTSGQVDNNSSDTIKLQGLRIETTYDNPENILIKKYSTGKIVPSKAIIRVLGIFEDGHEEYVEDHLKRLTSVSEPGAQQCTAIKGIYNIELKCPVENYKLQVMYENLSAYYPIKAAYAKHIYVDFEHAGIPAYQSGVSYSFTLRGPTLTFTLLDQPDADVTTTVHLNPSEGLSFFNGSHTKTITFDKTQWNDRNYNIKFDIKYTDLQNTNNATLTIDPLISEDTQLNGKVIDPVTLYKKLTPQLIAPYAKQLRGAVRGSTIRFQVGSQEKDLNFKLVNPPEGMRILGHGDTNIYTNDENKEDFEWKVPLDMEEGPHLITVQAEDSRGNVGEISFNITVPKTTLIQTEVVNNELIVTDTTSRLYGMKMKGHNGEDISNMELRSVGYRDLWKKRLELDEGDVPEYVPFVIYNMPEKLDIKFPEYLDTLEEARRIKAKFIRYQKVDLISSSHQYWKGAFNYFDYDGTNGSIVLNTSDTNTNLFLIVITKPQNIVD